MRKTFILLMFIFSTLTLLSKQLDSLAITELKKQNELILQENQTLKTANQINNGLIESQNQKINWFGILISILGGIVGVVSIALPLTIYFFQIRPAEKIIDEVKNIDIKVEMKLKEYLKNEDKIRIEKALDDISNDNPQVSNAALTMLSYNQFYNFKEEQLFKIYSLLKSEIDINKKSMLATILAGKKSAFADDFFSSILDKDENSNMFIHSCVKYFAIAGLDNYIDKIISYILTGNSAVTNIQMIHNNYMNVGISMILNSKQAFATLVNNTILNNGLDKDIRQQVYNGLKGQVKFYNLESILSNSLLAKGLTL
jgi:hypothetical protein